MRKRKLENGFIKATNRNVNVQSLITKISDAHCLKNAPDSYVKGFVTSAQNIYSLKEIESILQEKFFIPDDSRFNLDTYLQNAAELSVQNHLKRSMGVNRFERDKQVNPPKDVDAHYEVGSTRVSLEVKCAVEQKIPYESFVLKNVGRVPNHLKTFTDLKDAIESPSSNNRLELAKNKDNTMKDFLMSANEKFSSNSSFDDLNVLFVACGYIGNVQEWRHYLCGGEGLFTGESFHPSNAYQSVDVVLLSNLKYLHSEARQFHDWTLENAFLLPCVNPHGRRSLVSESVNKELGVFNHHLKRFAKYTPEPIRSDTPDYLMEQMKLGHYVVKCLEDPERIRYFPVKPTN
jgi:hypothetical protein